MELLKEIPEDISKRDLRWEFTNKRRTLLVKQGKGWQVQIGKNPAINLLESRYYHIPKGQYYRIIKGQGKLILKIKEDEK